MIILWQLTVKPGQVELSELLHAIADECRKS